MPFRPQTEKLKALHLQMHHCGRLMSDKPGAICKRCGPDQETTPTKTCKRGHFRNADLKRCVECDRERRRAKAAAVDLDGPAQTEGQRKANADAAEARAARRAGLGMQCSASSTA
jgi:hypothetical protein